MILRFGDKGEHIRLLQEQLVVLDYFVGNSGVDGHYGTFTEKAIKSFQRSNQVLEDGEAGPDTLRLLNLATGKSKPEFEIRPSAGLASKALSIAKTQLGVLENPRNSNRGKEVEMYLASIGLSGGYAWCMAFVYWCVNEAANANLTKNPLLKTGGVLNQWHNRQNLKVSTPKSGDIFIMDFGKGMGHTGFVEKVNANGTFEAIEGNTNRAGSREGDGVYRRTRNLSVCKGFLRVGA